MAEVLRPLRGGFLRPFGCAWFIREFLAGRGPNGSTEIDPDVGAPQTDINAEYKASLHRAFAEDMVASEEERRARRKRPPLTIEEAERLRAYYMERIPMKFTRVRYHSFLVYFGMLKRLGWVEATDREERSAVQEAMALEPGELPRETGRPRTFYRLTVAGRTATPMELLDPITTIYHYPREVRSAKRHSYTKR